MGQRSPGALRDWLAEIKGLEGAAGKISFFAGRRTNSELELLKISDRGWVRPLSAEDLPDLSKVEEETYDLDLPLEELELDEVEEPLGEGDTLLQE